MTALEGRMIVIDCINVRHQNSPLNANLLPKKMAFGPASGGITRPV